MGFTYRKSYKAGPFRITASKSGISYSAGVKGARVTKRADGRTQTTLSAPGTGLRYTSTTSVGRSPAAGDALVVEATVMLRRGRTPRDVHREFKRRGVGFWVRAGIVARAKKAAGR